MTIVLNHTIVPAHDKKASARFFAQLFGLTAEGHDSHFAPVRVNESFTLLFSDSAERFESHHYAFHLSDAEFDAILHRVKAAGLVFGSAPWALDDAKLNDWNGGRGVYFRDLDGHILELMTVPQ
jgi:catechol 2,3-dioxygenase-like lactoylglutathione lyase family enzyme